jgi:Der1-like family
MDATAFMGMQLVYAMLYIYCKREPLLMVSFLFGFKFKSKKYDFLIQTKDANFPWVLVIYELLTGASIERTLIGIAAGHTYIVLKDILPNSQYRYNFLQTPKFM